MPKKVAMLVTHGFEQLEMTDAKHVMEDAGMQVIIVSPQSGTIRAWNYTDWGDEFPVDVWLSNACPDEYDALVLHGGIVDPEQVRCNAELQHFVRHFFETSKPVGALCHTPWTWLDTDIVGENRTISYFTL